MILEHNRTYTLHTRTDVENREYTMQVTGSEYDHVLDDTKYFIRFTCKWEDRTFSLSYNQRAINSCIKEGTWKITPLVPSNQFEDGLFEI